MNLLLLLFLLLSPSNQVLLRQSLDNGESIFYKVGLDGTAILLPDAPSLDPSPTLQNLPQEVLDQSLFPPLAAPYPNLYLLSGSADPFTNFYLLEAGELVQLTNVVAFFPEATNPILSASVEYIAERPGDAPGFLFRARLRDSEGTDHNRLYLHDFTSGENIEMPYFGKDPVWSPDGLALAGSRLEADAQVPPLYELWIAWLGSGKELRVGYACNPQWSSDGEWLAYDLHDNSYWQGYTDCYANGEVEAYHLANEARISLSENIDGFVTLVSWEA
jgi:hypothetical protein